MKKDKYFNCEKKGHIAYHCPRKGKIAIISENISKNSDS